MRGKPTLDKDLEKLSELEEATSFLSRRLVAPGLALVFVVVVAIVASLAAGGGQGTILIVAAAAIGAYMALNIGANDVANNVSPAVGSQALTMTGALILAAVFETAGAIIAGDTVVETISRGILAPGAVTEPRLYVYAMMAALISAALWINLATAIGAPVSTTHAIVGGVLGAGVAAAGVTAVNWWLMSGIAASWVISPVMGGVIAAALLAFIKSRIIYRDDKISAARTWVPVLIGLMAGSFAGYLVVKVGGSGFPFYGVGAMPVALAAALLAWGWSTRSVARAAAHMENRNQSLRKLFRLPLIGSAALLSFAHGANDVANAVGPLAAIVKVASAEGSIDGATVVPVWVMVIGALGISIGLLLFGPRLVRMVGRQITRLNPMRAYCVALSAALTVIVASWLGMPVSSTHITVGAIFGVGFFREWYTSRSPRRRAYLARKRQAHAVRIMEMAGVDLDTVEDRPIETAPISSGGIAEPLATRRKLVRRAHVSTIVTAWVVTVPAAAMVSAMVFFLLRAVG